jgi:hypothetical protein
MQEIRIQITVLNEDDSASLMSWPLDDEEHNIYRTLLTNNFGEPEEAFYTADGVEAIDEAVQPEHVIVL